MHGWVLQEGVCGLGAQSALVAEGGWLAWVFAGKLGWSGVAEGLEGGDCAIRCFGASCGIFSGLVGEAQGSYAQHISEYSQRENYSTEGVAAVEGVPSEQLCEGFIIVFYV